MRPVTKTEAAQSFGSKAALARALGLTRQSVHEWPEELDQHREDWIRGAAARLKIKLPPRVRTDAPIEP